MKNKYKPFVHIGYGKSGSKTLQSFFFPKHPDIYYYGIDYSNAIHNNVILYNSLSKLYPKKNSEKLTYLLTNLDRYQGVDTILKKNILKDINEANKNEKVFVFSNENFSETPSTYLMSKVLKEYIPDANILVVLRNQFDLIKSVYTYTCHSMKHVPEPYKGRYVSFQNWFNHCIINENNRGSHKAWDRDNDYIRMIDFYHLISCLEVFFPKKVNIVLYEDLRVNSKIFYKKIAKILKIDSSKLPLALYSHKVNISSANQSLIRLAGLIKRFPFGKKILKSTNVRSNKFYNFLRNKLRKSGTEIKLNSEIKSYIQNRYKKGNNILAKKYKLPLKKYGYPL